MTGGSRRLRAKPAGRGGVAGESELTRQRNRGGGGAGGQSQLSLDRLEVSAFLAHTDQ